MAAAAAIANAALNPVMWPINGRTKGPFSMTSPLTKGPPPKPISLRNYKRPCYFRGYCWCSVR